jgi:hypothetical protein
VKGRLEKADEIRRRNVDHLNGGQAANAVCLALKIRQPVTLLNAESARAAQLDHRRVGVDAALKYRAP